ncbi:MAG: helix-turn-helix domain-containing protein [Gammaproteobacteria bacterium]
MRTASATTAPKRWITFALKRAREQAGKSRQDVVDHLDCTLSHVSHLETGRNLPNAAECEKLLVFYGLGERWPFFRELLRAAKKGKDWWKAPAFCGAEPAWFDLYLGLEAWARVVASYDALVTPGLFQTPEYAAALIRAGHPSLSDAEVQRRVDLRMERQTVLDREPDPLQVWSVLDEAALRRPVGGPEIMRAQLRHLVQLAKRPNVELQVLPLARGAHAGLDGTFTVLDFPLELPGDPGTVFVQNRLKGVYYEEPAEIDEYRQTLTRLQAQALTPADSPLVITRIAQETT